MDCHSIGVNVQQNLSLLHNENHKRKLTADSFLFFYFFFCEWKHFIEVRKFHG